MYPLSTCIRKSLSNPIGFTGILNLHFGPYWMFIGDPVGIPEGKTPFFKKGSLLGTAEKAQNHAKHYIYSGLEGFEEPRNQPKTDPKVTQKRKSAIIERIAKSAQVPYI